MPKSQSRLQNALGLWTGLRTLAREVAAAERELASPHGLSLVQGHALLALHDSGPLSMQAFADQLCIAPSTATRLADQLEGHGWIERLADPGDRRRTVLNLADSGQEIAADLRGRGIAHMLGQLRGLSRPEELIESLEEAVELVRAGRARSSYGASSSDSDAEGGPGYWLT